MSARVRKIVPPPDWEPSAAFREDLGDNIRLLRETREHDRPQPWEHLTLNAYRGDPASGHAYCQLCADPSPTIVVLVQPDRDVPDRIAVALCESCTVRVGLDLKGGTSS